MTDPVMLLSQLHGEGRVTFRAVRAAGFYTLASIAEATAQTLADRAHLSLRTARRLKSGAEELVGKGIGIEPADGEAAAARGAAGRATRKARRRAAAVREFSEGVSNDEARLLVEGAEAPEPAADAGTEAQPAAEVEPDGAAGAAPVVLPDAPAGAGAPGTQPAIEILAASRMAAAAEAAASLARPLPAPGGAAPDSPRPPARTFWVFG